MTTESKGEPMEKKEQLSIASKKPFTSEQKKACKIKQCKCLISIERFHFLPFITLSTSAPTTQTPSFRP